MADKLSKSFLLQQEFMTMLVENDVFPEFPVDLTTKPGQRFIREVAFNCIAELMEATVILKNKMHRLTDDKELDFPHYLEEIGDAFAYLMELCIVSNITAEQLYEEYTRKNKIVRDRLQNGY